jgi:hypothetical protein
MDVFRIIGQGMPLVFTANACAVRATWVCTLADIIRWPVLVVDLPVRITWNFGEIKLPTF